MIHTKKTGFPLKSFDSITREHPRLKINSFPTLRKALSELDEDHNIGIWLPLVEMAISSDKMDVQLIANVTVNELDNNMDSILIEAEKLLDSARIIYGRKNLSATTHRSRCTDYRSKRNRTKKRCRRHHYIY